LSVVSAERRKAMTDRIERQEVEEQEAEFVEELSDEALDRPPIVAWTSCSHQVLGPKKTGIAPKKAQA
jgi:hypothetical protein